jgi:hypothetical protein
MTKEDWAKIVQIRIEVVDDDGLWSFPIHCPRWLFWLLEKLEIR